MDSNNLKVLAWVGLLVLCLSSTAWSKNPMMFKSSQKKAAAGDAESITIPKDLNAADIDHFIAGLSDEQVRRLLIDDLKDQAQREARAKAARAKSLGIEGFIDKIKYLTAELETRIEFLRSGAASSTEEVSGVFAFLGKGKRGTKTVAGVILSVGAVLAGALLIECLFVLYSGAARRRIASTLPSGWRTKIGALSMQAVLDFTAIAIFIVAALAFFFLFLERTEGQRVLLAAYLAGLAIVQAAYLVLRFFLTPHAPALRFLPFSDETALYLYRWLMALTCVVCFGNLTAGVIRLAGATELTHIKLFTLMALVACGMIICMILQKRKTAAAAFSRRLPETSLRHRLAQKWHHFAIFAVLVLLASAVINLILGTDSGQGTLTLLMVPVYFLLDWLLCLMLEAAFGIAAKPEAKTVPAETSPIGSEDDGESEAAPPSAGKISKDKSAQGGRLELDRMKGPLRTALRLALAALLVFWTLSIWDVDFRLGEEVARTVLKILVVVLVCYVAWGLINAAIQRRMRQEIPEAEWDDEKDEGGGAGGSRIATLLLLLRKFMLVVILVMAVLIVLSALGVNIGPLIAGAGVFGLAIGFGAQTLVKDIISGVFFLMADAFRVGDYLEVAGAKGTVEHISLRSLRLRNPRGQVYFVPFGDIKLVTNLSRDYVIMKLDFRVRYDADVEKIRRIIKKKVHNVIAADPELGPKLLEPIKSQGVREMDDSAMIMRVKYKTKPGDQFAIRREVYHLMQEAFKKEGIDFAHRNVTVYMPPEVQESMSHAEADSRQKITHSGAAGAPATIEAKEQAEQAAKQPKGK
jgi:moderate conductance mechanosensitive channel